MFKSCVFVVVIFSQNNVSLVKTHIYRVRTKGSWSIRNVVEYQDIVFNCNGLELSVCVWIVDIEYPYIYFIALTLQMYMYSFFKFKYTFLFENHFAYMNAYCFMYCLECFLYLANKFIPFVFLKIIVYDFVHRMTKYWIRLHACTVTGLLLWTVFFPKFMRQDIYSNQYLYM